MIGISPSDSSSGGEVPNPAFASIFFFIPLMRQRLTFILSVLFVFKETIQRIR